MRLTNENKERWINSRNVLTFLTMLVSWLVYLFNIVRFPLFNNSFDPWFHLKIAQADLDANNLDLNAYNGFPGLQAVLIYVAKFTGFDLFTIVRWFPLISGFLSTMVMLVFLRDVNLFSRLEGKEHIFSRKELDELVIFGTLLNTTVSLYSLMSSGIFWGQMLIASLIPLLLIRFKELNQEPTNKGIIEFLLLFFAIIILHHLTSFFLVTFLTLAQMMLIYQKKSSLKAILTTTFAVLVFLIRYEALSLNISIVNQMTLGKTNYFYLYFLGVFLFFSLLTLFRKLIPKKSSELLKRGKSKLLILLLSLGIITLSGILLVYIIPYVLSAFKSLSITWFLYYGSNLILLAPLAITGVLIFGNLYKNTRYKIIIYTWVMTIIFVLLLLIAMYFLDLGVGVLEFGRLSTFFYPYACFFASFSLIIINSKKRVFNKNFIIKLIKKYRRTIKVTIIILFCILFPFSMIGFNPPPRSTLTRYWQTRSENRAINWVTNNSANESVLISDFRFTEMISYYESKNDKQIWQASDYRYYLLDGADGGSFLSPNTNYLIIVDDVIINYSFSYQNEDIEHGTIPALGNTILKEYNKLTFLDRVYCSDKIWIYSGYRTT
ncbi:MAG: hypothetical protein ACTSVI_06890 [Promethearchaeota archaeon]